MSKKDQNYGVSPEQIDDELSMLDESETRTLSREIKIGVGVILLLLVVLGFVLVKRFLRPAEPAEVAEVQTPAAEGQADSAATQTEVPTAAPTPAATELSAFPEPPASSSGWSYPPALTTPSSPAPVAPSFMPANGTIPDANAPTTQEANNAPNPGTPRDPFGAPQGGLGTPASEPVTPVAPAPPANALALPQPPQTPATSIGSEPTSSLGTNEPPSALAPYGGTDNTSPRSPAPSPPGSLSANSTYGGQTSLSASPLRQDRGTSGGLVRNDNPARNEGPTPSSPWSQPAASVVSQGRAHDRQPPKLQKAPEFEAAPLRPETRPSNISRGETYQVQLNDNFSIISEKLYGTVAYYKALAEYNRKKVPDANRLEPGTAIATPSVEQLRAACPAFCPREAHVAADQARARMAMPEGRVAGGRRTYTVQEGDTLFDIAKYQLGKASRWAELYDLNRDQLGASINYLKPGMKLELPEGSGSASLAPQPNFR